MNSERARWLKKYEISVGASATKIKKQLLEPKTPTKLKLMQDSLILWTNNSKQNPRPLASAKNSKQEPWSSN